MTVCVCVGISFWCKQTVLPDNIEGHIQTLAQIYNGNGHFSYTRNVMSASEQEFEKEKKKKRQEFLISTLAAIELAI